jgi:enoyl-CoA hydratase
MYNTLLTGLTNGIFSITINRPDKLNALNNEVLTELDHALDSIYSDAGIKTVLLTGAGIKAFAAGADISEFTGLGRDEAIAMAKRGQDIFFKIENASKPIVAAVNGFALGGGCELAMACHFRICSENAKFGQPEVNLGLIPGYGGTQRLTRLVGKGKSMELQMTASLIDAATALQLGLVNHVTNQENLIDHTTKILETIMSKAPVAIAKLISCINAAEGPVSGNNNGYELELESFADCFETADKIEGITAFLEKRKAVFTGK